MKEWTKEQITHLINEKHSGIVYFYTPMCGTCQVAGKMLEIVESIVPTITYGKVNLNYCEELASEFLIESVPCLLFISAGKVQEKIYAFQSVPFLYEKVKAFR